MFNASYFTYDGVYSGLYGLTIASLDSNKAVETTKVFAPQFSQIKSSRSKKFYHGGIKYDNAPQYEMTIISELPIDDTTRRELLTWLHCRSDYKKLEIHQPDYEDYYFMCVFTNINIVYINGRCHGFTVTLQFDSLYGYGKRMDTKTITGNGTEKTFTFVIKSDICDENVFPNLQFTINNSFTNSLGDVSYLSIKTQNGNDWSLPTEFNQITENGTIEHSLTTGSTVTIDGERKIISSNHSGDNALACFNKEWLKLRKGTNTIKMRINGTLTISYPIYCLIGF